MGFLGTAGAPMPWGTPANNAAIPYVRDHGIQQFITLFKLYGGVKNCPFFWGDEIEHIVVHRDQDGSIKLSLTAGDILAKLTSSPPTEVDWRPEYGSFMVESVPMKPYSDQTSSLLTVEGNMLRRYQLSSQATGDPNTWTVTMVSFPLMGVGEFTTSSEKGNEFSTSLFVPDICINQTHPRFCTLTRNIRWRRGRKVCIQIPLFMDKFTAERTVDKKYNIDESPANAGIQCGPAAGAKRKRTTAFSMEDDEEEGGEAVAESNTGSNGAVHDDATARKAGEIPPLHSRRSESRNQSVASNCCSTEEAAAAAAAAANGTGPRMPPRVQSNNVGSSNGSFGGALAAATAAAAGLTATTTPNASFTSARGPGHIDSPRHKPMDSHEMFEHLYTPATEYYYAQYVAAGEGEKVKNVKQRYDACPCPVPSVMHPCIYMDCMAFGMGLSCLQVTMQLADISESRFVYDQLLAICPQFLALTSATPIQKGLLCDSDVRWLTISASVDDRRPEEVPRFIKSRYDTASMYLSDRPASLDAFNDTHVEIEDRYLKELEAAGVDHRMAMHVAHLFIRDPLVIYERGVKEVHDDERSDHFENIQSTNWQSVRFKPPPFNSDIGWRVEFRVMEVQPTPFENAAFAVFVVLLTKAIAKFNINFYIPMSLVDQNTGRAHLRNPCDQKFFSRLETTTDRPDGPIAELSLDETFNGRAPDANGAGAFEGYIPLVRRYLRSAATPGASDAEAVPPRIEQYLQLLSLRAARKLQTTAEMLRAFVLAHPDYKQDSRVSMAITADIMKLWERLNTEGDCPGYLPRELTRAV